ncbi:MAG: hypothetical protein NZ700_16960 [Gemmataceae bacterium]|nr:hypothetical protein [Gemmataceae bacterium]MDW8266212.1 hypothetical protein [Gemmataceae bacterium]
MIDRLFSAAVAVTLAFLVWLYARSRDQEMLDNVPIPVSISLASGQADTYDLEVTGPSQVVASFSGPPSRMRELRSALQRGELSVRITLTVPEERQGEIRYLDTVRIDASDIHPPPGVQAHVVEGRNAIPVTLRKIVERRLPVRLDNISEERVGQVTLEPASVVVRGPQEILDRVRAVPTQPYSLPLRSEGDALQEVVSAGQVPLVKELEGRPIRTQPGSVAVQVTLRPRQKIYELTDVPVQFLCPANFPLRPQWEGERAGKISLKVIGPVTSEPPAVLAFIDLTSGKYEAALYADEPLRLQLPKDFQLAQNPPRSGTFRLVTLPAERPGEPSLGGLRVP